MEVLCSRCRRLPEVEAVFFSTALKKRAAGELVPGKPCPVCGKPVGRTGAERQRRYRERKRAL